MTVLEADGEVIAALRLGGASAQNLRRVLLVRGLHSAASHHAPGASRGFVSEQWHPSLFCSVAVGRRFSLASALLSVRVYRV